MPRRTGSSVVISRIVVVLPAPFGPARGHTTVTVKAAVCRPVPVPVTVIGYRPGAADGSTVITSRAGTPTATAAGVSATSTPGGIPLTARATRAPLPVAGPVAVTVTVADPPRAT